MKILVIGNGGREHTLVWKIAQSNRVDKIYCASGNGGTLDLAENVDIDCNNIDRLLKFALEKEIDLTIVGPEEPLVLGIVDKFEEEGLRIFGPNKESAKLEGSKEFSKRFMEKHNIPTARYKNFNNYSEAVNGLEGFSYPLVIKADGLCAGKGVFICETKKDAIISLKDIFKHRIFGTEGNNVIIEEFLDGVEASLICLVSQDNIIPLESAKDYKRVYDKDLGPNTGGMGCFSPSPLFTEEFKSKIDREILEKIERGLREEDLTFNGILFIGFMIVDNVPYVLEFNTRFGDPETEVLLPRLNSDLVEVIGETIDRTIEKNDLIWKKEACVAVIMTSKGYPNNPETGFPIQIRGKVDDSIILFHNGTRYKEEGLLTNGGRVMTMTSLGESIEEARKNIYQNIHNIKFTGIHYRKDIGIL